MRFDKINAAKSPMYRKERLRGAGRASHEARIELLETKTLAELPENIKEQITRQCRSILEVLSGAPPPPPAPISPRRAAPPTPEAPKAPAEIQYFGDIPKSLRAFAEKHRDAIDSVERSAEHGYQVFLRKGWVDKDTGADALQSWKIAGIQAKWPSVEKE